MEVKPAKLRYKGMPKQQLKRSALFVQVSVLLLVNEERLVTTTAIMITTTSSRNSCTIADCQMRESGCCLLVHKFCFIQVVVSKRPLMALLAKVAAEFSNFQILFSSNFPTPNCCIKIHQPVITIGTICQTRLSDNYYFGVLSEENNLRFLLPGICRL